jgi:TldD protein
MNKQTMMSAIETAISLGGDYAEVFFEDTKRSNVVYRDDKVELALTGYDFGAGVRVMSGTNCAYAFTCDVSEKALLEAAQAAAVTLKGSGGTCQDLVAQPKRELQKPDRVEAGLEEYADAAMQAYRTARAQSPLIVQATGAVSSIAQHVMIANSQGIFVEDDRARTRLVVQAVAASENEMQTGMEGPGAGKGFSYIKELDIDVYAKSAAQMALTMLDAPFCPAGQFPVVVDGGFGGVIFHEACGHSLEATSVSKGHSEFTGKLGQRIASDKVTALDDGTIEGAWGSIGYDDEGNPSRRNVLISNGILKGYLIDILGGRRMKMEPTGSGRRQNYRFAPTSRMTNTYIAQGMDTGLIEGVDNGLYAKQMGGGSVNPLTGEFNFAVMEGYWIKDGRIDRPVRGATLIGRGGEVIMRIDAVGSAVSLGQGMCGSISGSVPTNVGQPMIRVSRLLVGGREG